MPSPGRRTFLRRFLWAFVLVREPKAAMAQGSASRSLNADALGALEAVADTIVPRDRDPGAVDVGVPARIVVRLSGDPAALALYREGLELLERRAREAGASSFRGLDVPGRERVLVSLASSGPGAQDVGERFFARVRRDVLVFYWASPIGHRVVDYRPPLSGYPEYADPPAGARHPAP